MSNSSTIVQRVWNYCNVLRDDIVAYGEHQGPSAGLRGTTIKAKSMGVGAFNPKGTLRS